MSDNEEHEELQAPAEPAPVRIITETRNLRASPFIPGDDQITTGRAWDDWIEEIEREFRYFKITDPIDKKDALIIYGGKEIARLEKSLPNPTDAMNDYEKLRKKLNDYFTPKKNKQYARYLFLKMKPAHGETTVAYAARVREKGNECEFGTNCDDRILEHLIQTTHNRTLIQKAINKKWNLTQFLTEAAQMEDTSLQVSGMKIPEDVKKLSRRPGECQPPRSRSGYQKKQPCGYCGQVGTHPKGKNCPAYGKKCSKCQRFNHFATVCRADTPRDSKKGQQHKPELGKSHNDKQQRHIKRTTEESPDSSTSSDDEFFCQAVRHLKQVKKIKSDDKDRTLIVKIDNVDVEVEPDSGAEVNVLDEHQFKALTNRASTKPTLASSRTKLNTLQSELSVKGELTATIRNKTCGTVARFIVVKGRINSPPLIGKDTLQELGMLQIREDGTFAEKNDPGIQEEMSDIKAVKEDEVPSPEIKDIADRYSHVFQGIGKIRDNKNGQDFYAKFSMRPEAVPVAQKPRPVAYYLQEPLKKWLEQCLEEEIFEEVPEGEPVTWCSPLVVQPKPKFSELDKEDLEPHMIRASVDLRILNQFMERNRITQSTVGKDEEDPLDFLSRHPLPETGRDAVERVIKHVVNAEYAVVMDQIEEETQKDKQLQKLSARIQTGDWERHKMDPDIMPFYGVRHELYAVDDLMFRMDRIIIPTNLQRRVSKQPTTWDTWG